MIDTVKIFFENHYQWFFSGAGIFLIGGIASCVISIFKKRNTKSTTISTKGDNSPGYVGKDYKVEIKHDKH